MKTSHILLAIIAIVTLTGMVATDVLLEQQYEKIDWSDPYQDFERRTLPAAKHWVIEGTPRAEIIVEQATDTAQVLLSPDMAKSYRVRQQGDTLFVSFAPDPDGRSAPPTNTNEYKLGTGLVLRLPDVQSLCITNGRLTLRKRTAATLSISLKNSQLYTEQLTVNGPMTVVEGQKSLAVLGADQYQSLRLTLGDLCEVQLNDTQTEQFLPDVSPKADVKLRGRALRWLAR